MPFINSTNKRAVLQEAIPDENVQAAGFGETFAAALGSTIDEDLSISFTLNREGWENRRRLIEQKIDDDQLDRNRYLDRMGRFDYNRAAIDLNDPEIKTDKVLTEERNAMLANRRAYTQDVLERGNGMAQFLGMANAYMLDPISIATMPIALPATGAKSLSIAGRALLTARNAAAIETATELAIQPLVYQHKQDIDSPYTYRDALENIAGAAIGASVLGGAAGGVSGYLRKVNRSVVDSGVVTPETEFSMNNLGRLADTVDYGRANRDTLDDVMSDYDTVIRGESDFATAAAKTETDLEATIKTLDAEGKNTEFFDNQLVSLRQAVETGEIESYYKAAREQDIQSDITYLNELEIQRKTSGQPSVKPEHYFEPPQQPAPKATVGQREDFILEETGMKESFNRDMESFRQIEKPVIIEGEETIDAVKRMGEFDKELEGIDAVLVCARG